MNLDKDYKTYLCVDLGTTRIKSALLDNDGNIIYLNSEKVISYSEGAATIQKPEEIYRIVLSQIKSLKNMYTFEFNKIESIIFSGQMAGILSINREWEVVVPWTYSIDTRANKYIESIEKRLGPEIRRSSGGVPFMAAKMVWIKSNFPSDYKKSYKFINLHTYVAGKLAGLSGDDAFIDCSVLSMSGMADVKKGIWNKKIIRQIGLDIEKLPIITIPYCEVGSIPKKKFQTKNNIKVLAGVGDTIASFLGAGILERGDFIDVTGTYTVLGCACNKFIPDVRDMMITSIYSGIEDIYYHLAVIAVGGYLYNWFLDRFNFIDKKIQNPKDTEGLIFIPHFGGRISPPQPYYEGTIFGLNWKHDLESIYMSMLECIGYEYEYNLKKISKLCSLTRENLNKIKVIGGGSENYIWNQIKANILGLDYIVMNKIPFEILGNYLIARYKGKLKKGYRDLLNQNAISVSGRINPEKEKIRYYKIQKDRYRKIVSSIGSIYKKFRFY